MKESSNKQGISLVVLIVTIIVLIILTAAVVVTFMEGGIVDRAKEAVFKNDMRTYQEQLLVKKAEAQIKRDTGTGEETDLTADDTVELKQLLPELKDEYIGVVNVVNGELVLGANVLADISELEGDNARYKGWLNDLGIGSGLPENAIAKKVSVGDYVNYDALISGEKSYTIAEGNR